VKLKHEDIRMDVSQADFVLLKYLQGADDTLTDSDHEIYYEIHLKNRKGWQKKTDKGNREIDLRSKLLEI